MNSYVEHYIIKRLGAGFNQPTRVEYDGQVVYLAFKMGVDPYVWVSRRGYKGPQVNPVIVKEIERRQRETESVIRKHLGI